ncbi:MAG: amidohydrolase [Anaerolineaceae bacterium]|nr:amidohydrolase [Anaerolineaceae bacterium]
MAEDTRKVINKLSEKMQQIRQDFHKYAEPGWLEFRTASLVARKLTDLGYEIQVGREVIKADERMGLPDPDEIKEAWERAHQEGGDVEFLKKMEGGLTGVVATLKNGNGPSVGFRFDMDALYVVESQSKDHRPAKKGFASIHEGIMHACGHDGHVALGLGLAEALPQLKDSFKGTVKLIFQPAEEGVRGAKSMVAAGVVDDLDYVIGSHLYSGLETGKVVTGLSSGTATSKFDALITGSPAHAGGTPQSGKNALLAASTAVLNLYAIPRHADGPTRINVGKLEAGTGRNVICSLAKMLIETRGATIELNEYMVENAERILQHAADMYSCDLEIKAMGAAPVANSDPELVERVKDIIDQQEEFEVVIPEKGGGSEDFTYMMQRVQSRGGQALYLGFGADLGGWGHHTAEFDVDESALGKGLLVLILVLKDLLN